MRKFINDEKGDTNIVPIIIIIVLVIVAAIIFKPYISKLISLIVGLI